MSTPLERARRGAENEAREMVADAESPLAQRHIRDGLRKNKLSWVLYAIALMTPAAFLLSFYFSKMGEIRRNFRDPYALPEGFDPNTGKFTPPKNARDPPTQPEVPAPKSLVLGDEPGAFNARGKRLAKEQKKNEW